MAVMRGEMGELVEVQSGHVAPVRAQAEDDDHLIDMWLHGKAPSSKRAYAADIAGFRAFVGKPLREVTVGDVQAFQDTLTGATASRARRIGAVKSLLTFGQTLGYLQFNVAAPVKAPPVKQALAERILDEDAVLDMIHGEDQPRNRAILRLLYLGGLRISEVCNLRIRDLKPRDDAGQVTIFGKGGRERVVLLKASAWRDLIALRVDDPDAPVFRSREGGGPLDPSQVHRIVKKAAARAGLSEAVSAHWLRHAHVSHALDHGAPPHLVQQTVGHASLTTTSRYAHARPNDSSSHYLRG